MRKINEIIVHCTATRPEWWSARSLAQKIAEVRAWHVRDRGWKDIGYHYLIDRNGKVGDGRPVEQVGAHVQGRNTGTIGIALFGGHGSAASDEFSDNFTAEQEAALLGLIADLHKQFGPVPVTGHNQYSNKACPGFRVPDWFASVAVFARHVAPAPARAAPAPRPVPPATTALDTKGGPVAAFLALLARIFGDRK